MMHTRTLRNITIGLLLIGSAALLGTDGCLGPTPPSPRPTPSVPTITGAGISGTLVQGQPGTIRVEATVTADNPIAAVTANLLRLGGSQAQPLALDRGDLWAFEGTLTPPNAGQQRVTIIATDDAGVAAQTTATVNVASTQPDRTGPTITNATASGTLIRGIASSLAVSANVVAVDGTISSVVADLSEVGGFSDTPLTPSTGDLWSFQGLVVPIFAGTQNITIEATDSLGDTSATTVSIAVTNSAL